MRFTNICLEGPDCSGKTTLFNNIHKETNYKYSTWLAEVKNDGGWGMSTNAGKLKKINAFD